MKINFTQIKQKTVYGQSLDLLSSPTHKRVNIDEFTIDRYFTIAKYKTAFYSTVLPIRLALYYARISDAQLHRQLEQIMVKMGIFWQIQDDYLDAFGNPQITGKIGTDIQDGKCCWPAVMSLKLANNVQRDVLHQHFGINQPSSVEQVKQVYKELHIEDLYHEHEDQLFAELLTLSQQFCERNKMPPSIFKILLSILHRRKM